VDDARQAVAVLGVLALLQQLRGVADGGERIADLVRDVGGQAAERGELELLRLVARARRVLDEQQAEALLRAGVEQAQADVATGERELGRGARRDAGAPAA